MPRPLFLLPLLAAPILVRTPQVLAAPASSATASTGAKLTFLDDDAEAGGFDITANVRSLPLQWSLCQDDEGRAYILKLTATSTTISLKSKDGEKVLARVASKLAPGALVVQRRGAMWRVLLANKSVLEAEDATLEEGKVGYMGSVSEARLQPVEDIAFDDDFMRVKEDVAFQGAKADPHQGIRVADVKDEAALWRPVVGSWATTGLSENAEAQVAQSVNAFVFKTTKAGESMALTGRPFWNDYSVEASVRPEGASAVGLAFYAQDAKNYLILKWQAREGMDEASGRVLLQSVVDGKESTLAQSAGGFENNQWYRLKVSVVGDLVRAYVDDNEVARVRTTLFGRGQAGLWAQAPDDKSSALFDDVRVRSDKGLEDDFSRRVPGRWVTQGNWSFNGAAQATSASAARAVMGNPAWSDYSVAAPVALPADANVGVLLHESAQGAYLLRAGGSKSKAGFAGQAQILKLSGGKAQVLATAPIGSKLDGKAVTLGLSADDGYLSASIDGVRVADAFDESLRSGRAGLWSWRAGSAPTFGAFAVRFPDARPTWAKVPELYVDEKQAETMGEWSTPEGSWTPSNPMASPTEIASRPGTASTPVAVPAAGTAGAKPKTMWHKGTFWGDGSMKFKAPDLSGDQSFVILLDSPHLKPSASSGASNDASANPAQLAFTMKDGALQAALTRLGEAKPLASGSLKIEGKVSDYTIDIRQRGSFMIARAYKSDESRSTLFATRVK